MKHYPIQQPFEIPYPVGRDMVKTIEIVREMVDIIRTIYSHPCKLHLFVKGSSGAILAGIFTTMLPEYNIVINHVKKSGEHSHHGNSPVSDKPEIYEPIVILDDFISSGSTVNSIADYIKEMFYIYRVDILCVSGSFRACKLNFTPEIIICNKFEI